VQVFVPSFAKYSSTSGLAIGRLKHGSSKDTKNGKASLWLTFRRSWTPEGSERKAQGGRLKSLSFKVSERGCLSVYVWVRFPVTLYRGTMGKADWAVPPQIKAFIDPNARHTDDEGQV